MSSSRRHLGRTVIVATALLVASGCGGGDEAAMPVDAGVTPQPATGADPNTLAGDGMAADAQVDPLTGLPVEGADTAATATVPDLVGDDVAGGLEPVASTHLFAAGAIENYVKPDKPAKSDYDYGSSTGAQPTTPAEPKEEKPKVTYTGAKVYVDGIVHSVDRNGTFPKGNPVFKLLSVNAGEIEIELVAGEFTSGGGVGTFLDKGDLVSMVNASEQITYRIKYLRPITSTTSVGF